MVKNKQGLYRLVIVLLMGVFMLAGCGAKEKISLDRVKEAGEISFAMSGGYPPFNYYDATNQLVGFDVDVCKEVATRLGVEFKPITTDFSGLTEGLRAGIYDGILGSMAITEERLEVVDFTIPYYYSGAQLIVKKGGVFTQPQDLKGKVVGVATGTTFEKDAEGLGVADVRLYKDDNQTLLELDNGVIDGVITDRVVGVNAINTGNFEVELLGAPLRSEDIAVAFRKEDKALKEAVNEILQEMHEDGTLSGLSEKWLQVDITQK